MYTSQKYITYLLELSIKMRPSVQVLFRRQKMLSKIKKQLVSMQQTFKGESDPFKRKNIKKMIAWTEDKFKKIQKLGR